MSTEDLDRMDGSTLRKKLEEALASNRDLESENRSLKVERVTSRFGMVKASDLEGVAPDELEAKAKEIQAAKLAEQTDLLKRAGLTDEQIEKTLAGQPTAVEAEKQDSGREALGRITALGGVGAKGTAPKIDASNLSGPDKIKAYFAAQNQ